MEEREDKPELVTEREREERAVVIEEEEEVRTMLGEAKELPAVPGEIEEALAVLGKIEEASAVLEERKEAPVVLVKSEEKSSVLEECKEVPADLGKNEEVPAVVEAGKEASSVVKESEGGVVVLGPEIPVTRQQETEYAEPPMLTLESESPSESRFLVDCPRHFVDDYATRMRQQIWLKLKDVNTHVFLVSGWKGVGKSRIMRQVIEEVQHQQPPFFDIITKVRMLGIEALGEKMNMKIWSALPIDPAWRRRVEDEAKEARAARRELQIDHSQRRTEAKEGSRPRSESSIHQARRRRKEDDSEKATTSAQTKTSIDELWRRRIEDESKEARATRRWEVQRSIAQALGIDVAVAFMPPALQKRISRALESKRFLLIVEDVWESIDFSKVGVPTPTNGSKLLITARSMQRFPSMGVKVSRLEEGKDDGGTYQRRSVDIVSR